jgi:hypothetical protein
MSYHDWRTEPAWYIDLLLDHLDAEEPDPGASGGGPVDAPDTLAEWR